MARTSAALLVDSDIKGLESLVYGFQGVDWRSMACPAPETAVFLVKASAADILVIAAREPYDKTLTLLRQLRSSEETRTMPVLVIGPASLRPSVRDCGSIDFLPTPVFVRDVITASRILVSLGKHDPNGQGREQTVDGTLADFGFLSTIRVMNGLLRSGVLQVERGNRRGEILFSEGEIAGAQVGSLQGPPAIHHLLLWEEAKVELRLRSVARRGQFNRRVDQIVDEAERFVRDYAHAIQGLGPTCSIFERNESRLTGSTVPSEIAPVLRLCDGRRTLTDIVDESPFRVFDTVRILSRLLELGVLVRPKPQDGSSAPTPPLQKFWEAARIANPEDISGSAPRPAPANLGQLDSRIVEPNRRRGQRRASIDTPIQGTPIVGGDGPNAPLAAAPALAPSAPAAQDTDTRKTRISGTIDLRAMGDRRQVKPDSRPRPSMTIDVGQVEAASASAPVAPLVAMPAVPPVSPPRTGRVTGTLQVTPSAGHRRSTAVPRIGGGGISVEIDPALASEANLISAAASPAVPVAQVDVSATVGSAANAAHPRTGATPTPIASTTAAEDIAASPAPIPAPVPTSSGSVSSGIATTDGARPARLTGTLSVAPSQRSATTRPPVKGASVQLDPVLMAELGRLERATTPVGPPESDEPVRTAPVPSAPIAQAETANASPAPETAASLPAKASNSARVTGTFSVSPFSRSSASPHKAPKGGFSVALDPALVAEAQKLDAPKPQPAAAPEHAPGVAEPRTSSPSAGKRQSRGTASSAPASVGARPTPHTSEDSHREAAQPSRTAGRISGTFNDVERDFFAREADLYKREAEDNFSDLDEPAGRGTAKRPPGRGPAKRHP
jgi:hypothetical protein